MGAQQETQAEKQLKPILLAESIHVLSSFELNQIASLSYGDLVCDEIFEMMENMFSKPLEYTPLTLQKSLVVLKHLLIYGSEKCVNSGYGLMAFVDNLTKFNTVLLAHQQQGTMAFLQRIQGGGVDKGGPVREAAAQVKQLLSNINELQRIRNESASQDSLVPIGSDKVAFITDEVRHYLLKRKIEEQQKVQIKSNLAKSEGGFGGGYNAADGTNVVGAAHGIEEMLKMAKKENNKFSDEKGTGGKSEEEKILEELLAEAEAATAAKAKEEAASNKVKHDLLDGFNPNPTKPKAPGEINLLDFGGGSTTQPTPTTTTADLLGGFTPAPAAVVPASQTFDLLGMTSVAPAPAPTPAPSNDLLDLASAFGGADVGSAQSMDPFSSEITSSQHIGTTSSSSNVNAVTSIMTDVSIGRDESAILQKKSVMTSNEDRYSAFDALSSEPQAKVTALDAISAENRLLSATATSPSSLPMASGGGLANLSISYPPSLPTEVPPLVPTANGDSGVFQVPMGVAPPVVPAEPMAQPGSGNVSTVYGDSTDAYDDNPWVMGGSAGSGLQPVGPAPGTAPPPPPP